MADLILLHLRKDGRPWLINRDLITDIEYFKVTHQDADPKKPPQEIIHAEVGYGGFTVAVLETPEQIVMLAPYALQMAQKLREIQKLASTPDQGKTPPPTQDKKFPTLEVSTKEANPAGEAPSKSTLPGS